MVCEKIICHVFLERALQAFSELIEETHWKVKTHLDVIFNIATSDTYISASDQKHESDGSSIQ